MMKRARPPRKQCNMSGYQHTPVCVCMGIVRVCWPVGVKVSPPSTPSDAVVTGIYYGSWLCLGAQDLNSCPAGTLATEPSPQSLPFKLLEMHFLSAQLGRAP